MKSNSSQTVLFENKIEGDIFQKTIWDNIQGDLCNIIIQAVAGSGKTFTIVRAIKLIDKAETILFLAFNKSIKKELEKKVPTHVQVSTLHSHGLKIIHDNLMGVTINPNKLSETITALLESDTHLLQDYTPKEKHTLFFFLEKIIPYVKNTLADHTDEDVIYEICEQFNIYYDLDRVAMACIARVLEDCKQNKYVVDFDDMIWLPIVLNLQMKQAPDWIFIDELQDTNLAQIELIKRSTHEFTRIVAVGDVNQSIYSFRGADSNSMQTVKEHFSMKEFPLSICYRCPTSHVQLAQEIVPQILPHEHAIEGVIECITYISTDTIKENSLVLCRTNAPLVRLVFNLIRGGRKATIRGEDIGKSMISAIKKEKYGSLYHLHNDINLKIVAYEDKLKKTGALNFKRKRFLQSRIDFYGTLQYMALEEHTIDSLVARIKEIFTDQVKGIVCSSVHRAKGLENDIVYILDYKNMPHPLANSDMEQREEMNIKYVALTRSKRELYFLTIPGEDK